jgi:hypothetical protein
MKRFIFSLLLIPIGQLAMAQTTTVTGNVKDTQGDPLHFAFVQDSQKHGAYTDSLGNFSLELSPNATLRVNCAGYRDTTFVVNNSTNLAIVMSPAANGPAPTVAAEANAANQQSVKSTLGDAMTLQNANLAVATQFDAAAGATLPVFMPKEETVGSRYLIKGWSHGYVINSKDATVQNPGFLFAYDKMGGGLLLTKDRSSAVEINKDLVKSFTLYDNVNRAYTFERVPQIDDNHYVEVVASGNKYKIYKAIKTRFEKANYSSDGVMSSGNNYDEYVDEDTYYVYNVQTNALQKIALKKKAIKEAFAKDDDKVNKFMSDNSGDIDDNYLSNLGSYMNE